MHAFRPFRLISRACDVISITKNQNPIFTMNFLSGELLIPINLLMLNVADYQLLNVDFSLTDTILYTYFFTYK